MAPFSMQAQIACFKDDHPELFRSGPAYNRGVVDYIADAEFCASKGDAENAAYWLVKADPYRRRSR